jgi:hypothetical protein
MTDAELAIHRSAALPKATIADALTIHPQEYAWKASEEYLPQLDLTSIFRNARTVIFKSLVLIFSSCGAEVGVQGPRLSVSAGAPVLGCEVGGEVRAQGARRAGRGWW